MSKPSEWLRPEVAALSAYNVADARGLIKLDAMENPHAFPAHLREQWQQKLAGLQVNRYPDAAGEGVKAALRQAMEIPSGAQIMLGNGSDELLQVLMLALAKPGASLVTPEPGFAMFRLISQVAGLRYVGVPLAQGFALDVNAMLATIRKEQPALVIIAQPNNPTGNAFDTDALREIVAASPGLVVIDEAYYPFAASHCLGWLEAFDNLLVMRTLSKLGLAGLRLGFLVGPARWLAALEPVRLPYNINSLTQASAEFALNHYADFQAQAREICAQRSVLASALGALKPLEVYPSEANFLLVRVPHGQANVLHAGLREQGILVKNMQGSHPQVADCLRFTVGTADENAQLIEALKVCLRA